MAWEMLFLTSLLLCEQQNLPRMFLCLLSRQGRCCSAVQAGQFIPVFHSVESMARLGLGGLMEYKHLMFIKYCEYSAQTCK